MTGFGRGWERARGSNTRLFPQKSSVGFLKGWLVHELILCLMLRKVAHFSESG